MEEPTTPCFFDEAAGGKDEPTTTRADANGVEGEEQKEEESGSARDMNESVNESPGSRSSRRSRRRRTRSLGWENRRHDVAEEDADKNGVAESQGSLGRGEDNESKNEEITTTVQVVQESLGRPLADEGGVGNMKKGQQEGDAGSLLSEKDNPAESSSSALPVPSPRSCSFSVAEGEEKQRGEGIDALSRCEECPLESGEKADGCMSGGEGGSVFASPRAHDSEGLDGPGNEEDRRLVGEDVQEENDARLCDEAHPSEGVEGERVESQRVSFQTVDASSLRENRVCPLGHPDGVPTIEAREIVSAPLRECRHQSLAPPEELSSFPTASAAGIECGDAGDERRLAMSKEELLPVVRKREEEDTQAEKVKEKEEEEEGRGGFSRAEEEETKERTTTRGVERRSEDRKKNEERGVRGADRGEEKIAEGEQAEEETGEAEKREGVESLREDEEDQKGSRRDAGEKAGDQVHKTEGSEAMCVGEDGIHEDRCLEAEVIRESKKRTDGGELPEEEKNCTPASLRGSVTHGAHGEKVEQESRRDGPADAVGQAQEEQVQHEPNEEEEETRSLLEKTEGFEGREGRVSFPPLEEEGADGEEDTNSQGDSEDEEEDLDDEELGDDDEGVDRLVGACSFVSFSSSAAQAAIIGPHAYRLPGSRYSLPSRPSARLSFSGEEDLSVDNASRVSSLFSHLWGRSPFPSFSASCSLVTTALHDSSLPSNRPRFFSSSFSSSSSSSPPSSAAQVSCSPPSDFPTLQAQSPPLSTLRILRLLDRRIQREKHLLRLKNSIEGLPAEQSAAPRGAEAGEVSCSDSPVSSSARTAEGDLVDRSGHAALIRETGRSDRVSRPGDMEGDQPLPFSSSSASSRSLRSRGGVQGGGSDASVADHGVKEEVKTSRSLGEVTRRAAADDEEGGDVCPRGTRTPPSEPVGSTSAAEGEGGEGRRDVSSGRRAEEETAEGEENSRGARWDGQEDTSLPPNPCCSYRSLRISACAFISSPGGDDGASQARTQTQQNPCRAILGSAEGALLLFDCSDLTNKRHSSLDLAAARGTRKLTTAEGRRCSFGGGFPPSGACGQFNGPASSPCSDLSSNRLAISSAPPSHPPSPTPTAPTSRSYASPSSPSSLSRCYLCRSTYSGSTGDGEDSEGQDGHDDDDGGGEETASFQSCSSSSSCFSPPPPPPLYLRGHVDEVSCISSDRAGHNVASCALDGRVLIHQIPLVFVTAVPPPHTRVSGSQPATNRLLHSSRPSTTSPPSWSRNKAPTSASAGTRHRHHPPEPFRSYCSSPSVPWGSPSSRRSGRASSDGSTSSERSRSRRRGRRGSGLVDFFEGRDTLKDPSQKTSSSSSSYYRSCSSSTSVSSSSRRPRRSATSQHLATCFSSSLLGSTSASPAAVGIRVSARSQQSRTGVGGGGGSSSSTSSSTGGSVKIGEATKNPASQARSDTGGREGDRKEEEEHEEVHRQRELSSTRGGAGGGGMMQQDSCGLSLGDGGGMTKTGESYSRGLAQSHGDEAEGVVSRRVTTDDAKEEAGGERVVLRGRSREGAESRRDTSECSGKIKDLLSIPPLWCVVFPQPLLSIAIHPSFYLYAPPPATIRLFSAGTDQYLLFPSTPLIASNQQQRHLFCSQHHAASPAASSPSLSSFQSSAPGSHQSCPLSRSPSRNQEPRVSPPPSYVKFGNTSQQATLVSRPTDGTGVGSFSQGCPRREEKDGRESEPGSNAATTSSNSTTTTSSSERALGLLKQGRQGGGEETRSGGGQRRVDESPNERKACMQSPFFSHLSKAGPTAGRGGGGGARAAPAGQGGPSYSPEISGGSASSGSGLTPLAIQQHRVCLRQPQCVICGTLDGRLILHRHGFFFTSNHLLHSGEGPVTCVSWRNSLVAWSNTLGVKILDIETQQKVSFVPRVSPPPSSSSSSSPPRGERCQLEWAADDVLCIAWNNLVRVVCIRSKELLGADDGTGGSSQHVLGPPSSPHFQGNLLERQFDASTGGGGCVGQAGPGGEGGGCLGFHPHSSHRLSSSILSGGGGGKAAGGGGSHFSGKSHAPTAHLNRYDSASVTPVKKNTLKYAEVVFSLGGFDRDDLPSLYGILVFTIQHSACLLHDADAADAEKTQQDGAQLTSLSQTPVYRATPKNPWERRGKEEEEENQQGGGGESMTMTSRDHTHTKTESRPQQQGSDVLTDKILLAALARSPSSSQSSLVLDAFLVGTDGQIKSAEKLSLPSPRSDAFVSAPFLDPPARSPGREPIAAPTSPLSTHGKTALSNPKDAASVSSKGRRDASSVKEGDEENVRVASMPCGVVGTEGTAGGKGGGGGEGLLTREDLFWLMRPRDDQDQAFSLLASACDSPERLAEFLRIASRVSPSFLLHLCNTSVLSSLLSNGHPLVAASLVPMLMECLQKDEEESKARQRDKHISSIDTNFWVSVILMFHAYRALPYLLFFFPSPPASPPPRLSVSSPPPPPPASSPPGCYHHLSSSSASQHARTHSACVASCGADGNSAVGVEECCAPALMSPRVYELALTLLAFCPPPPTSKATTSEETEEQAKQQHQTLEGSASFTGTRGVRREERVGRSTSIPHTLEREDSPLSRTVPGEERKGVEVEAEKVVMEGKKESEGRGRDREENREEEQRRRGKDVDFRREFKSGLTALASEDKVEDVEGKKREDVGVHPAAAVVADAELHEPERETRGKVGPDSTEEKEQAPDLCQDQAFGSESHPHCDHPSLTRAASTSLGTRRYSSTFFARRNAVAFCFAVARWEHLPLSVAFRLLNRLRRVVFRLHPIEVTSLSPYVRSRLWTESQDDTREQKKEVASSSSPPDTSPLSSSSSTCCCGASSLMSLISRAMRHAHHSAGLCSPHLAPLSPLISPPESFLDRQSHRSTRAGERRFSTEEEGRKQGRSALPARDPVTGQYSRDTPPKEADKEEEEEEAEMLVPGSGRDSRHLAPCGRQRTSSFSPGGFSGGMRTSKPSSDSPQEETRKEAFKKTRKNSREAREARKSHYLEARKCWIAECLRFPCWGICAKFRRHHGNSHVPSRVLDVSQAPHDDPSPSAKRRSVSGEDKDRQLSSCPPLSYCPGCCDCVLSLTYCSQLHEDEISSRSFSPDSSFSSSPSSSPSPFLLHHRRGSSKSAGLSLDRKTRRLLLRGAAELASRLLLFRVTFDFLLLLQSPHVFTFLRACCSRLFEESSAANTMRRREAVVAVTRNKSFHEDGISSSSTSLPTSFVSSSERDQTDETKNGQRERDGPFSSLAGGSIQEGRSDNRKSRVEGKSSSDGGDSDSLSGTTDGSPCTCSGGVTEKNEEEEERYEAEMRELQHVVQVIPTRAEELLRIDLKQGLQLLTYRRERTRKTGEQEYSSPSSRRLSQGRPRRMRGEAGGLRGGQGKIFGENEEDDSHDSSEANELRQGTEEDSGEDRKGVKTVEFSSTGTEREEGGGEEGEGMRLKCGAVGKGGNADDVGDGQEGEVKKSGKEKTPHQEQAQAGPQGGEQQVEGEELPAVLDFGSSKEDRVTVGEGRETERGRRGGGRRPCQEEGRLVREIDFLFPVYRVVQSLKRTASTSSSSPLYLFLYLKEIFDICPEATKDYYFLQVYLYLRLAPHLLLSFLQRADGGYDCNEVLTLIRRLSGERGCSSSDRRSSAYLEGRGRDGSSDYPDAIYSFILGSLNDGDSSSPYSPRSSASLMSLLSPGTTTSASSSSLLPFLPASSNASEPPLPPSSSPPALLHCEAFLLGRLGRFSEALHILVEDLADIPGAVSLAWESSDPAVWRILVSAIVVQRPCYITEMVDALDDHLTALSAYTRRNEGSWWEPDDHPALQLGMLQPGSPGQHGQDELERHLQSSLSSAGSYPSARVLSSSSGKYRSGYLGDVYSYESQSQPYCRPLQTASTDEQRKNREVSSEDRNEELRKRENGGQSESEALAKTEEQSKQEKKDKDDHVDAEDSTTEDEKMEKGGFAPGTMEKEDDVKKREPSSTLSAERDSKRPPKESSQAGFSTIHENKEGLREPSCLSEVSSSRQGVPEGRSRDGQIAEGEGEGEEEVTRTRKRVITTDESGAGGGAAAVAALLAPLQLLKSLPSHAIHLIPRLQRRLAPLFKQRQLKEDFWSAADACAEEDLRLLSRQLLIRRRRGVAVCPGSSLCTSSGSPVTGPRSGPAGLASTPSTTGSNSTAAAAAARGGAGGGRAGGSSEGENKDEWGRGGGGGGGGATETFLWAQNSYKYDRQKTQQLLKAIRKRLEEVEREEELRQNFPEREQKEGETPRSSGAGGGSSGGGSPGRRRRRMFDGHASEQERRGKAAAAAAARRAHVGLEGGGEGLLLSSDMDGRTECRTENQDAFLSAEKARPPKKRANTDVALSRPHPVGLRDPGDRLMVKEAKDKKTDGSEGQCTSSSLSSALYPPRHHTLPSAGSGGSSGLFALRETSSSYRPETSSQSQDDYDQGKKEDHSTEGHRSSRGRPVQLGSALASLALSSAPYIEEEEGDNETEASLDGGAGGADRPDGTSGATASPRPRTTGQSSFLGGGGGGGKAGRGGDEGRSRAKHQSLLRSLLSIPGGGGGVGASSVNRSNGVNETRSRITSTSTRTPQNQERAKEKHHCLDEREGDDHVREDHDDGSRGKKKGNSQQQEDSSESFSKEVGLPDLGEERDNKLFLNELRRGGAMGRSSTRGSGTLLGLYLQKDKRRGEGDMAELCFSFLLTKCVVCGHVIDSKPGPRVDWKWDVTADNTHVRQGEEEGRRCFSSSGLMSLASPRATYPSSRSYKEASERTGSLSARSPSPVMMAFPFSTSLSSSTLPKGGGGGVGGGCDSLHLHRPHASRPSPSAIVAFYCGHAAHQECLFSAVVIGETGSQGSVRHSHHHLHHDARLLGKSLSFSSSHAYSPRYRGRNSLSRLALGWGGGRSHMDSFSTEGMIAPSPSVARDPASVGADSARSLSDRCLTAGVHSRGGEGREVEEKQERPQQEDVRGGGDVAFSVPTRAGENVLKNISSPHLTGGVGCGDKRPSTNNNVGSASSKGLECSQEDDRMENKLTMKHSDEEVEEKKNTRGVLFCYRCPVCQQTPLTAWMTDGCTFGEKLESAGDFPFRSL